MTAGRIDGGVWKPGLFGRMQSSSGFDLMVYGMLVNVTWE
jgi:hypothetical protein